MGTHKTVYFVRHGESDLNDGSAKTYSGSKSTLTTKGCAQTEMIATRAARLKFDSLIASPWVRASDTAEAISRTTGHTIEYSDLFTESRSPSSFYGREFADGSLRRDMIRWKASIYEGADRVEDGENFDDLKARALQALQFLEAREESSILVVSHGLFLRAFACAIAFGSEYSVREFTKFAGALRTDNTGISIFTYSIMPNHDVDPDVLRWRIRVLNDHAHLG